jgi:hypothetical protein
MRKDLFASIGLLLIAALYYAATTTIQTSTLDDEVGATGLPTILATVLAIIAIVIGARAVLAAPAQRNSVEEKEAEAPWPRALGLLGIGLLYLPFASFLGYPLALFLLLTGVALYEGARPGWRMFAITIGGALFFWLIFDIILGVRQPEGILF